MTGNESHGDQKIIEAWFENADPWIVAIQQEQIESRKLVTNQAIIDAVVKQSPNTVLDIGCGEGWLARALQEKNIKVHGVDVVLSLIQQARKASDGEFNVMSYEDIATGSLEDQFDMVVCNFSLLGKESVENLFKTFPTLLNPKGSVVVQTLHPATACGDHPYQDGWRDGSWAGFSSDFKKPAPWYFRTVGSWIELYTKNGLRVTEMREPLHPSTQKATSLILTGIHL